MNWLLLYCQASPTGRSAQRHLAPENDFHFNSSTSASFPVDRNGYGLQVLTPVLAGGGSPKDSDKNNIALGGSAHCLRGFAKIQKTDYTQLHRESQ